jgi:3-carboxy-cis,cis-muconate cycloisomerase
MLDFELALMRALVSCQMAPVEAAEALNSVADAERFDIPSLGQQAGEHGSPVPGLLAALRRQLPEIAQAHLHRGATSQDVLDSAMMLVARRALASLLADLDRAGAACADLASAHRATLMPGRTLLQQALPIPFGLKAANWLVALEDVRVELDRVCRQSLALQFGGAVGTLSALGDRGLDVARALGDELDLPLAPLPWHTARVRPAQLACALGIALGAMAKVARDVVLLAQTEVAEAREGGEPGRGGSSTMPHKRNPVGAITVLACAGQAPALVAAVLGAMAQEHERAAGGWQSESEPLRGLLRLAGSAAAALVEVLADLVVDGERMRADLDLTGAAVMAESVVTALSPALGRAAAQRVVKDAVGRAGEAGCSLDQALSASEEVMAALGAQGIREALDPEGYLGVSGTLIDRALARRRAAAVGAASGGPAGRPGAVDSA